MTEHQVSDYAAGRMRDARKENGWSTEDLAARCGLTVSMIENIESGRRDYEGMRRRDVTVDELVAIANAFGVTVLEFLPGKITLEPSDQEKRIQDAEADLERMREELDEAAMSMRAAEALFARLNEQVEKQQWLIEQMRGDA